MNKPDKKKQPDDCDRAETEPPQVRITPVTTKIGESRDNLRKRGEWFDHRVSDKK